MIPITEELTSAQKKRVDKYKVGDKPKSIEISKHVIPPGTDRVVIPLSDPNDKKLEAPKPIQEHLAKHGFEVHDYVNGHAKDKHGRTMKIGKALQQTNADPHLINSFNSDPERANAKQHANLQVVVSRHPYDVAGMSTNRSWTSCMDMDSTKKGNISNAHYLHHEVKNGTHVAYLTQKGDDHVKNPVARIALKPFTSEDGTHHILRPEDKQYGNAASAFEHTVNSWTNEHFEAKPDTFYHKSHTSYNDSEAEHGVVSKHITDEMLQRNLHNSEKADWETPKTHDLKKRQNVIQHIAALGTHEHRHAITDYYKDKKMPYGIGYTLAEFGDNQTHHNLLDHGHATDGVGEALANFGDDSVRHKIIDKNIGGRWTVNEAVGNMKDKKSLVKYVNHPDENIRQSCAYVPELEHHLLDDPSDGVRSVVVRHTTNKKHFDHIVNEDAKTDYVHHRVAGNIIKYTNHIVARAHHNYQFGDELRNEMSQRIHNTLTAKRGDDWI